MKNAKLHYIFILSLACTSHLYGMGGIEEFGGGAFSSASSAATTTTPWVMIGPAVPVSEFLAGTKSKAIESGPTVGTTRVLIDADLQSDLDVCLFALIKTASCLNDAGPKKLADIAMIFKKLDLHLIHDSIGHNIIHLIMKTSIPLLLQKIVFDLMKQASQEFLHPTKTGDTPLHIAAYYGNAESIALLLTYIPKEKQTSAVLAKNNVNLIPLHIAIRFNKDPNVIKLLLNCLPDEKTALTDPDAFDRKPLYLAAENESLETVNFLLKRISMPREGILQALHHAVTWNKNIEITKRFLDLISPSFKRAVLQKFRVDECTLAEAALKNENPAILHYILDEISAQQPILPSPVPAPSEPIASASNSSLMNITGLSNHDLELTRAIDAFMSGAPAHTHSAASAMKSSSSSSSLAK